MDPYVELVKSCLEPLFWVVILLFSGVGLLALACPRVLASANRRSSKWIDSAKFFALLDKRLDVDHFVLRHSRVFGLLTITTAGLLLYRYWSL